MDTDRIVNVLTGASLVAIMISMGLKVTLADLSDSVRRWRLIALGLIANFALVPAATLALLAAFGAQPLVSVGFFILAVCPGAPVGPPMTAIARGDVPFSIAMMIVLSALSAFLSPVLLLAVVPWIAPATDLHIDCPAIVRALVVMQLLPLAMGLALRQWAPVFSGKICRFAGVLANVMLLALVTLIVVTQIELLAAIRLRAWIGMTLLLVASLAIGWYCGGADRSRRKSMALTTSSRNIAVGLLIAGKNMPDTPAVLAVIAFGLYCIVGTAIGAFWQGRRAQV